MKRFLLACILFSVWFAIAGTYYTFVIKGVDSNNDIVAKPQKIEKNKTKKIALPEPPIIKEIDTIVMVDSLETKTIDTLMISNLVIRDKDFILKKYFGNFKIFENNEKVQIPFGISEYGYVVAKHMDSINSSLIIEGFYNQNEIEENGTKRALFLKNKLVNLGIPDSLIKTKSTQAIFDYEYKKFIGGINFEFLKAPLNFELDKIDYSKLANKTIPEENFTEKVSIVETQATKPTKIEKADKKISNPKNTSSTKSINDDKKVEKVSYTVLNTDFKNGKFRPNRKFKAFLEANSSGKNLELLGFSNANTKSETNYNKGIELASLVNEYIKKKGLFSGPTKISALRKEKSSNDNLAREGVTLLIIK